MGSGMVEHFYHYIIWQCDNCRPLSMDKLKLADEIQLPMSIKPCSMTALVDLIQEAAKKGFREKNQQKRKAQK
jgi:hypothetical protein